MEKERKNAIQVWGERINWKRRVKAICKPCWEIKYCPYGPLVEDFPLKEERDYKTCRVFGHDCPVFYMAEPFTETKDLRNISRSIPRSVQFRVLKRENQICRICSKNVQDEDIHFDHIIPYSKGGSSDESNIRLLCSKCNLKRKASFEEEYLISSVGDHLQEPVDESIVEFLEILLGFSHDFIKSEDRQPTADDIARMLADGEKTHAEEFAEVNINDAFAFFSSRIPKDFKKNEFEALKFRWGFIDGNLYHLKDSAKKFEIDPEDLLDAEINFIKRMGWNVSLTKSKRKKWLKM